MRHTSLCCLLQVLTLTSLPAQGPYEAFFEIREQNGLLALTIKLSKNEVAQEVKRYQLCEPGTEDIHCAALYVERFFSCTLENDQRVSFLFEGGVEQDAYILLQFSSEVPVHAIHLLTVNNNCFTTYVPPYSTDYQGYKNHMSLSLGDTRLSYHMDAGRVSVTHKLQE